MTTPKPNPLPLLAPGRRPYCRSLAGQGILDYVLALDESLWAATSTPVSSFRCNRDLLDLLDTDDNGRVRTDEVKTAARWVKRVLREDIGTVSPGLELELAALNTDDPEGAALELAGRRVLRWAGRPDAGTVALDDVRGYLNNTAALPLNGDGVLVPEAARDAELAAYLRDVIAATGGTADVSGAMGVSDEDLAAFEKAVGEYLDWSARSQSGPDGRSPDVLPFGDRTAALHAVVEQQAARVEHYFALCGALAFDSRLAAPPTDSRVVAADLVSADNVHDFLEEAPVARPAADQRLALDGPAVNPRFSGWLAELRGACCEILKRDVGEALGPGEWHEVRARLAPYAAYLADKRGGIVEGIPRERLQDYRDGARAEAARRLLVADSEVAGVVRDARELERLLVYRRSLPLFLNNFVTFGDLYDLSTRAMFEMGSAVIDGRWFNLAVRVDDIKQHAAQAGAGNLFTIYLEVKATAPDAAMTVALPATAGSRGNLVVGKRGVFFDTNGREYDARVVQIIENPISLREALTAPFKRLWSFIVGRIEAMSGASEKAMQSSTDAMMKDPSLAPPAEQAGATAASRSGLLMGLSVSLAAIGSAFAFVTKTLSSMSRGQVMLSLAGTLGAVLAPVFLIAVLKLWQQDLSVLLEGCGWAVNSRMRLTRAQRRSFTRRLEYPGGPGRFAVRPWLKVLLALAVAAAAAGLACRAMASGLR